MQLLSSPGSPGIPGSSGPTAKAEYGKYAFSFSTLDGKKINLADYSGKVVLVNIWATWCSPCRKETPGFVKLREKYKERGFEVLGVAVQSPETAVRAFIDEFKVTYPIGIKDAVAAQYGTYGLPDTYLFGPDGSLIKHFFGFTKEELLEPLIAKAVGGIPAPVPPGGTDGSDTKKR